MLNDLGPTDPSLIDPKRLFLKISPEDLVTLWEKTHDALALCAKMYALQLFLSSFGHSC